MRISIGDIRSDFSGFSRLAKLAHELNGCMFDTIDIDFSPCSWLDANMSAPLGVIFAHAIDDLNNIQPSGLNHGVETILTKNKFLVGYGYNERTDTYGTTIPYQRFNPKDNRYFAAYLNKNLERKELPKMSEALSYKFKDSILEIFDNAASHSETKLGIFACGQYFPTKNRLDFCVADAGIGIRKKIREELGLKMNSDQAIVWALQEGNTTRKGRIPGGLGLKLLRKFITLNQGRIQIVSDRGYWELT
ncbi:MAG TPA: ATP-binding protein, partial [Gammaproteobacteria bacterium]